MDASNNNIKVTLTELTEKKSKKKKRIRKKLCISPNVRNKLLTTESLDPFHCK